MTDLLDKVAQLHHLIKQVLEISVGDLAFDGGDEDGGFVVRVGAQRACLFGRGPRLASGAMATYASDAASAFFPAQREKEGGERNMGPKHTQLAPLEAVELNPAP